MNTTKETLRIYWQQLRHYPGRVIGLLASLPVAVFSTEFLTPLLAANILDKISARQFDPNDIWSSFGHDLIVFTIAVFIAAIVGWRIVIYFIWTLEARVLRDLSRRVFSHLLAQSANFHANSFGGSLVSQAGKLNSGYVRLADTTVFATLPLLISIILTAVILAPKAPGFVAAFLFLCIVFVIVTVWMTKRLHSRSVSEAQATSDQVGQLSDSVTNVLAVKSFAAGAREKARFAVVTDRTRKKTDYLMRGTLVNEIGFGTFYALITSTAMVIAVMGIGIWGIDVGTIFLMLTYSMSVANRLWEFSIDSLRDYTRAFGDARDMVVILNTKPEVNDPPEPEKTQIHAGQISFRDMSFTHDGEGRPLFRHFNLEIAAGEKVGLVGHSGSGKSTLAKLLLRFADVDAGEILIDRQNIALITQDDLRRKIAYVPQESLLFHRSITENIGYGRPDATEDDIRYAAAKAHAAEFIDTLPQGYDTLVGERGVKLSGGQRQRIAIARALLKRAPILLLDEATSALDSESEHLIQIALAELMTDRTTLVIAHRLSTIQRMDRIVVFDRGAIAEMGTHQELLARGGTYAALWQHQSGGFLGA